MRGMRLLVLSLLIAGASAQFRGGSINWEVLDRTSRTVRFTIRTAWDRGSANFVKIEDGVAQPMENYVPHTGDTVNVLAQETPKFMTSFGFETYLRMQVTHATPEVGGQAGFPATVYDVTNWVEGTTIVDVKLPEGSGSEKTYVAEVQGCCRQETTVSASTDPCTPDQRAIKDGRGIRQMCGTPYHLRATVNLDLDPPPLSFLPFTMAWEFKPNLEGIPEQGSCPNITDLELPVLPVLDYRATFMGAAAEAHEHELWTQTILDDSGEAKGRLAATAPELRPSSEGFATRKLLAGHLEEEEVNLDVLPEFRVPAQVMATTSRTGLDIRMVNNPLAHIKLYANALCNTSDFVEIPAGSDLCAAEAPMHYPSGLEVKGNVGCMHVPQGLTIDLYDSCQVSESPTPSLLDDAFNFGNKISFDTEMRMGAAATSYVCEVGSLSSAPCQFENLPSSAMTFRATQRYIDTCFGGTCDQEGSSVAKIFEAFEIRYMCFDDGRIQPWLHKVGDLTPGNYPLQLQLATSTSAMTVIEIILHVTETTTLRWTSPGNLAGTAKSEISTGFAHDLPWKIEGDDVKQGQYILDNNIDTLFGGDRPSLVGNPALDPVGSGDAAKDEQNYLLQWSPCSGSVGMYFFCATTVQWESPNNWANLKCQTIRVYEDQPVRIGMRHQGMEGTDGSHYTVHMGGTLNVEVMGMDNPSEHIQDLALSKVDLNTGDSLRARLAYVYEKMSDGITSISMPRIIEPGLPPYLSLTIGGRMESDSEADYHRLLTFTPTRLHSGLQMTVCFMAVDARGVCPKSAAEDERIGSGTERCMTITVHRCKYQINPGDDMVHIAGMFEINWIQLFALNPTYPTPEVASTATTVINIGHLYKIRSGDTLYDIMRQLGTNQKQVMLLNAEFNREAASEQMWTHELPEGNEVCVVPDSCKTMA